MDGFCDMHYERFGYETLDQIADEELAPQITIPALMFRNVMDDITPIEDSRVMRPKREDRGSARPSPCWATVSPGTR